MLSPRWRKMLRDLWLNKPRALLVVVAMAIGAFGGGLVAGAESILTREQANIAFAVLAESLS